MYISEIFYTQFLSIVFCYVLYWDLPEKIIIQIWVQTTQWMENLDTDLLVINASTLDSRGRYFVLF